MLMNVQLEIDWIEEDGSIDDEIKSQLIHQIKKQISVQCLKDVENKATKAFNDSLSQSIKVAEETIGNKILKFMDCWLKEDVVITDEWGDEKERTTIKELVKKRFDNMLHGKVDKKTGRPTDCSYDSMPMIDFLMGQHVSEVVESRLSNLSKDIDKKITEAVNQNLKDKVDNKFAELVLKSK